MDNPSIFTKPTDANFLAPIVWADRSIKASRSVSHQVRFFRFEDKAQDYANALRRGTTRTGYSRTVRVKRKDLSLDGFQVKFFVVIYRSLRKTK